MEWKQQFEIIARIFSQKLIDRGQKVSLTKIAREIDIPLHKYQAWQNGQKPVSDDLAMLARKHEFSCDWLLLGIGKPLMQGMDNPLDPDLVDICDTFHDIIPQLPDDLPRIAEIGGMTTTALHDIINTQTLPPADAIAKWIIRYRLNANFLLAQIGQPFLTDEQYNENGKLDYVRNGRGDYQEAAAQAIEADFREQIDELKERLEATLFKMDTISGEIANLSIERRSLQQRLDNTEAEKRALEKKVADMELERLAMLKEIENLKKKDQAKAAAQE